MRTLLKQLWHWLLHFGDISGKVMTLIALPSAVFAIVVFYDEIGDSITDPDVKAEVHNVGLRCGVAISTIPKGLDPETYAYEECLKAPISAWVKLDLENEDAIDRTLAAVALRIHFPKELGIADTPLLWTEARVTNHVLQNDWQVSQRWPWTALPLAAHQRIPIEIDFRAFEDYNQKSFSLFRDLILNEPSPLADSKIPVEILGWFSGLDDWVTLGSCVIPIPKESVDRKRQKPKIRALTRRCDNVK